MQLTTLATQVGVTGIGYELAAESTERLVRGLRQHVMYCDSVAIDNPLGATSELWFGARSGVWYGGGGGAALARYFELLADLEDLISSGALILVEHPYGIDPSQDARFSAAREAERELMAEISERSRPDAASLYLGDVTAEELFLHDAVLDMARCMSVCGRSGVYQRYAPGAEFERALVKAQGLCLRIAADEQGWPIQLPTDADAQERARVRTLLRMELPNLDALRLSDVKHVREDGAFAALRRDIAPALDDVMRDVDEDDPQWPSKARRVLAERLEEPRRAALQASQHSQVLGGARRALAKNFVLEVGGVASGVGLLLNLLSGDALESALANLGQAAVAVAALKACWGGLKIARAESRLAPGEARDRGQLAAYRHLCVLSPPTPAGAMTR